MSGFIRGTQAKAYSKAEVTAAIVRFIGEREIADLMCMADPFGIENLCTLSPTGQHYGIGSCGEVVCCHCSKVF